MPSSFVCPCVCVCVSVTLRYCIKTAKCRIMQIMPHDRSATLVYTDKRVVRSLCHSRASCCLIKLLSYAEAVHMASVCYPRCCALQPLAIVTCNSVCVELLADPHHKPKTRSLWPTKDNWTLTAHGRLILQTYHVYSSHFLYTGALVYLYINISTWIVLLLCSGYFSW